MKISSLTLGLCAVLLLSGEMSRIVLADEPQPYAKPHIGNGPAEEKSVPSSAPAATTTQNTGTMDQNHTVKTMNDNEKEKIEANGK